MDFLTGYTIKPHEVRGTGEVYFTDGTNNGLMANQVTCEAYGYTYDPDTGSCRAFRYNEILNRNFRNVNNKFNGPGNTAEVGSDFVQINGTNNTAKGGNTNCFINGSDNEIAENVSGATVLGIGGKALNDGEFVVGSGGIGDTSTFSLNGTTTGAVATPLGVNNTLIKIIARPPDIILTSFTFDIIGYRTGGSAGAGAVSDRIFLRLEGLVLAAVANQTISTIVSYGTVTGWTAAVNFTGVADMQLEVTGAANMDITWKAKATFQNLIV
jgi:hypothetical protein